MMMMLFAPGRERTADATLLLFLSLVQQVVQCDAAVGGRCTRSVAYATGAQFGGLKGVLLS